jgi:hypothetical protein
VIIETNLAYLFVGSATDDLIGATTKQCRQGLKGRLALSATLSEQVLRRSIGGSDDLYWWIRHPHEEVALPGPVEGSGNLALGMPVKKEHDKNRPATNHNKHSDRFELTVFKLCINIVE